MENPLSLRELETNMSKRKKCEIAIELINNVSGLDFQKYNSLECLIHETANPAPCNEFPCTDKYIKI